jgi:hypothetical protein
MALILSWVPILMLNPNFLPKAPFPNTIAQGARISIYEFWRETNIQSITDMIIIFQVESYLCLELASGHCHPTYSLLCSLDHRHMPPGSTYWFRSGLANFLLRSWTTIALISISQVAGITAHCGFNWDSPNDWW